MNTQWLSQIVLHSYNGNEDEVKVVEVDGAKFVADDTDPSKPKLDADQKPIPFVEKKVEDIKIEDFSKADLEQLAKVNPKVAEMLDSIKKRDEEDGKKAEEAKKKEDEAAAKNGEWQGLAEKRGTELETTKGTLKQKEEMLGKYVETTQKVLDGLLKSIPKENLTLIPSDFSPRQKLEYIIANAARLGAKVNAAGGKIEDNEEHPAGSEEDKLVARIEELTKKATDRTATATELAELRQMGSKLTEIRRKKEADSK